MPSVVLFSARTTPFKNRVVEYAHFSSKRPPISLLRSLQPPNPKFLRSCSGALPLPELRSEYLHSGGWNGIEQNKSPSCFSRRCCCYHHPPALASCLTTLQSLVSSHSVVLDFFNIRDSALRTLISRFGFLLLHFTAVRLTRWTSIFRHQRQRHQQKVRV